MRSVQIGLKNGDMMSNDGRMTPGTEALVLNVPDVSGWEFDAALIGSVLDEIDPDMVTLAVERVSAKIAYATEKDSISNETFFLTLDRIYSKVKAYNDELC